MSTKPQLERRALSGIEIRAEDGKPAVLRGYAAVFDKRSLDLGGFTEVVRKGAFARSLAENSEILALAHHDSSKPLARRSAGTLTLTEDDTGLLVEIQLADTTAARDVAADIRARNIEGMSFGFSTRKDSWTRGAPGELDLRELHDVQLFEVSAVTMPAYPDTSLAMRSRPQDEQPQNNPADIARLNELNARLFEINLPHR
jgi:HK97 family phage prohead protease